MSTSKRNRIVILVAGLIVVAAFGAVSLTRSLASVEREIKGTIASLNLETRHASLSFKHPRTWKDMTVDGVVPADCPITIDGRPATLADLHVGEHVRVRCRITADKRITPLAVVAVRKPANVETPASMAEATSD